MTELYAVTASSSTPTREEQVPSPRLLTSYFVQKPSSRIFSVFEASQSFFEYLSGVRRKFYIRHRLLHLKRGHSMFEHVEIPEAKSSDWVLDPRHTTSRRWDKLLLVCMAWTCVVTPYEVAFLSKQNGARYKPTIIFFFNRLLDIVFTLDIVLNLFTGYYDPHTGQWVLELKKIFKRYMRGWFAVDLISVLPVDYISIAVSEADLRAVRLIRVLRLLRLFKLLRVLRVSRIFRRIESSFDLDYCLIEMLRFAVWTCLLAHWVACGMSLIDSLQPASSWTWLDNYFCEYPVECDPRDTEIAWDLYVTSLYWSITTITTIGYGDIAPQNPVERMLTNLVMLIGAFQYGYIIGGLSSILATRDLRKNRYIRTMMELNAFMDEGKFPQSTKRRLREYFKYRANSPDVNSYHAILRALSPTLRGEVARLTDNNWLTHVKGFEGFPGELISEVALVIQQQTYPPGEYVFQRGRVADTMYIIKKGLIFCAGRFYCRWNTLKEDCLYKTSKHDDSALTTTYSDIWFIPQHMMCNILVQYPEHARSLRRSIIRRIFREEVRAYMQAVHAFDNLDSELRGSVEAVAKFTFFGSLNMRAQFYFQKLQLSTRFTDRVGVMRTLKRAQRRFQNKPQRHYKRPGNNDPFLEPEIPQSPQSNHLSMIEDDALDSDADAIESQRRPEELGVRTLSMLSTRLPEWRMPRMQIPGESRFEDLVADTRDSTRNRIDRLEEAMESKHKELDKKLTYITKLLEHSLSKEILVRAHAEAETQMQTQTGIGTVKRRTRVPTAYTASLKPVRGPSVTPIDYDET
ncbi:hypothetical protein CYMTET_51567 [Cymbomonas tetramitiformis]|uniref:Cyclic nucleotide-binding domain-containing protein n=1 Tax=Cymbomonas tetramitiformis TaxID=36881 RepID=A0AAE0ETK1_9CHLO|nr:hypothetical protein CYMTET_51567 [Cymbomonas tetramitiformis]